jgi:glutamate N-acetyltransferase/amino-acid N-acetyltransferase
MRWPDGASSAAGACGIKSGDTDTGLLVFDAPATYAGVFTTNAAAAAPVKWCRSILGSDVRALVVNSGNANACTGEHGMVAVKAEASAAAAAVGCDPREVVVASTGPIGVKLPVERIVGLLPGLTQQLTNEPDA